MAFSDRSRCRSKALRAAVPASLIEDTPSPSSIPLVRSDWFNPHMNYLFFTVPGILVMLLTMIGSS